MSDDLSRRQRIGSERRARDDEFDHDERRSGGDTARVESMMRAARNVARDDVPRGMPEFAPHRGVIQTAVGGVLAKVDNQSFVQGFLLVAVVVFMGYFVLVQMGELRESVEGNTEKISSMIVDLQQASDSVREGNALIADLEPVLAKVHEIDRQMDALGGQFWQQRQMLDNALRAFDAAHDTSPQRRRAYEPAQETGGGSWIYGAPPAGHGPMNP